jgi:carnitine-CoA ligase
VANVFSSADIPLEERTVGRLLARAVALFGNKPFLQTVEGEVVTYADLDRRSNRLAHGLAGFGIGHQDPVLIMLPDVTDYIAVWCGLGKRGAIEVPVNVAYRKSILRRICNDSGAKTIIVDRQYLDRLEEIAGDLESLECCVLFSQDETQRGDLSLPPKLAERCRAAAFEELLADDEGPFEAEAAFHDLVGIMYTSGTTGPSKGVAVTHAHSFAYAEGAAEIFALCPEDVFYNSGLPLFHVGAQWAVCYASMIYGGTVILRQGYSNDHFWPDIAEHGGTVVFLLGAIANFLWQQPETPKDAATPLKKVGMFPLVLEHEAFAKRFGVEISSGYASTEDPCPMIHHFGEPFPNNKCVGYARTDKFEVRIFDELDRECPRGTMGEICVRPKNSWDIMLKYWNQPEYTAESFRNLWYHTGDAGYQDEEGRFYFVDRLTDSMRRRGENISSMEVEDEVNQHPGVLECAVFPVWDEHSEQEVMVVITPKAGKTVDPVELIAFLDKRMAYFMVPRYVDFSDDIPKTPTGKIQKFTLRDKGVTPTTWDRVKAGVKLSR